MKLKQYITQYTFIFISLLTLCMGSCSVEDGEDGLAGLDGTDGINGTDGNDGIDGIDGLGFDELTQFGDIAVTIEGIRPDDQSFTQNATFSFMPINGSIIPDVSSVEQVEEDGETSLHFFVARTFSAPNEDLSFAGAITELIVTNPGEENQSFEFRYITELPIIAEDLTFFNLSNFENNENILEDVEITDFSFDEETNRVQYSFSLTIPAGENTSTHDVFINGVVDVTVLNQI